MEILAKAGLVVMVLAVIFADKLPTAKKQDGRDFYSLIAKKYCDKCRVPINKEKRREAQRRYRERKKKYNSELQKKADALEFENNLLYQQVFGNDNTPRAKKIKKLLKELSKLEKDD